MNINNCTARLRLRTTCAARRLSLLLLLALPAAVQAQFTFTTNSVPWPLHGVETSAHYQGTGPAVISTDEGAPLRCVFQRLGGEATREGLWLTSTATNAVNDRFRIVIWRIK